MCEVCVSGKYGTGSVGGAIPNAAELTEGVNITKLGRILFITH